MGILVFQIKLLTRFLSDASMSGGSWVMIRDYQLVATSTRRSTCSLELTCSWTAVNSISPDIVQISQSNEPQIPAHISGGNHIVLCCWNLFSKAIKWSTRDPTSNSSL